MAMNAVAGLAKTVRDLRKPEGTPASIKNAADWNKPGGGYDKWKQSDAQRVEQHPIGSPVTKMPDTSIGRPTNAPDKQNIPMYHDGKDNVPETGPAMLKKGEAVLNPKEARIHRAARLQAKIMGVEGEESKTAKGQDSPVPEKKKRKVKEMHIRRGSSGGYIVKHDMHEGEGEEHIKADRDSLMSHISEHMGDDAEPMGADMAGPALT